MKQVIRLLGPVQRDRAKHLIDRVEDGYVVEIKPESRRDVQNAKMWAMIKDIRSQVEGMSEFAPDDVKNRFMHALGVEMRFLPALEGAGMFPVGLRSSHLTKKQFADLIELMYAYGAERGVLWTEPDPYI